MNLIECVEAGTIPYQAAFRWQKELERRRLLGKTRDRLLLLEHPPVITMGRREAGDDLRVSDSFLKEKGIELIRSDRGGRMTYHGPGQLVGYLIFQIRKEKIGDFVGRIEKTLIRLLRGYHLEAETDENYPGVWVKGRKIASLGLHVGRGVTTHGFSLNVTCDLAPFDYLYSCGIRGREVTSMERELGWRPLMRDVKHHLLAAVARIFEARVALVGNVPAAPE